MKTHREEAGFEDTEEKTERNHDLPGLDKSEEDHDNAPENADSGQERTRADLAQNNGSRWLQEDVCEEEHQHDDRVALADQFEIDGHSGNGRDALLLSALRSLSLSLSRMCWGVRGLFCPSTIRNT